MGARFENIQVGDQLELPARKVTWIFQDGRNPERVAKVAVVTHRWHDPVEHKDYVALAYLLKGGVTTEPKEKRTILGLAQAGWRLASQDWIEWAKAVEAPEVIPLSRKRRSTD